MREIPKSPISIPFSYPLNPQKLLDGFYSLKIDLHATHLNDWDGFNQSVMYPTKLQEIFGTEFSPLKVLVSDNEIINSNQTEGRRKLRTK